jgi:phage-related holin
VDCVDLVTGVCQEFFIKRLDFLVVNFLHATTKPADEVVMVMVSHLVDQLPVANMGNQYQTLFG